MEYKIIATLGPSSNSPLMWEAMLAAGVDAFRLNTSHLSLDELETWLEHIQAFTNTLEPHPPLILDLQGSKWRLGQFATFDLQPGQKVQLVSASSSQQNNVLPVPHLDFFSAASLSSGEIVLNDAKTRMKLESIEPGAITATVTLGGTISANKGITFTDSEYRIEALNEKDQAIIDKTRRLGFIRYAISYIKDAAEMLQYRALMGASSHLIAKLERQPAINEAAQIADIADELWLCRGDLGAELGMKDMAEAVYQFSQRLREYAVPVYLAGQVLEHLTLHQTPTRSEVCYLYDTIQKGYRGLVLSDETAIGKDPISACLNAAMFK
jgi:pyruvate kinase